MPFLHEYRQKTARGDIAEEPKLIITMVTETYWPDANGVAMTLHCLVQGLAKQGHTLQLVCPSHQDREISHLPATVLYTPVRGLPIPSYAEATFGLPAAKKLKSIWSKLRPDVIYVATEGPLGWSAINTAKMMGIPAVSGFHTNFHAYSRHYKIGFLEPIVKKYLVYIHNATFATVVPTMEQKALLTELGIKNVHVMGRGVDTGLFSPHKRSLTLREKWGVKHNEPVMIYVGRIAEEKNLDLTIRTYFELQKLNHKLKFVLVGDGPLKERFCREHPQFIMAGKRSGEELAEHYASADIFAFASLTETFGNVVLEAMASGLGIIAYDYAAARLHIKHGENGMLASFGDANAFIQTARQLATNEVLLKKLRINAGKDAEQLSWKQVIEQFGSILREQIPILQALMEIAVYPHHGKGAYEASGSVCAEGQHIA